MIHASQATIATVPTAPSVWPAEKESTETIRRSSRWRPQRASHVHKESTRQRKVLLSSLVVILVLLGKHLMKEATMRMATVCLARQAIFQARLVRHSVNHATLKRHQKLAPPFASSVMPDSTCRHHRLPPPPLLPLLPPLHSF